MPVVCVDYIHLWLPGFYNLEAVIGPKLGYKFLGISAHYQEDLKDKTKGQELELNAGIQISGRYSSERF